MDSGKLESLFSPLFPDALSLNWNSDMEGSCKKANSVVLKERGAEGEADRAAALVVLVC